MGAPRRYGKRSPGSGGSGGSGRRGAKHIQINSPSAAGSLAARGGVPRAPTSQPPARPPAPRGRRGHGGERRGAGRGRAGEGRRGEGGMSPGAPRFRGDRDYLERGEGGRSGGRRGRAEPRRPGARSGESPYGRAPVPAAGRGSSSLAAVHGGGHLPPPLHGRAAPLPAAAPFGCCPAGCGREAA